MMFLRSFRNPQLLWKDKDQFLSLTWTVVAVALVALVCLIASDASEAAERKDGSGIVLAQFSGSGDSQLIGAQDIVEITVFNVPELSKSLQVADTGTINFPLLGEVPVAGKTAQQVERDLTARLGAEYLQNPQVSVYVKENNSRNFTVSGAVKSPGVYPLEARTSLLQAIAIAGELSDSAETTVLLLRGSGGKGSAARFDIRKIQKGQMADPTLRAGDKIVVGESAIKKGFNTVLKSLPLFSTFGAF